MVSMTGVAVPSSSGTIAEGAIFSKDRDVGMDVGRCGRVMVWWEGWFWVEKSFNLFIRSHRSTVRVFAGSRSKTRVHIFFGHPPKSIAAR